MSMVEGSRPWYDRLAPDGDSAGGGWFTGEEMGADARARVLAWWRRVREGRFGVWLERHTGVLDALAGEESLLARRLAAAILLVGFVFGALAFLASGGSVAVAGVLALPVWLLALAGAAGVWVFWDAYRDSDERIVDRLASNPGLATFRQVAEGYSTRSVMRDVVPQVLPRMLERHLSDRSLPAPMPWQAAWMAGRAHHMDVWLSAERHVYVLGPTRSGKTVGVVIPAVVEAPGFCLATSTRADVIRATRRLRGRGAYDPSTGARWPASRVHVFDPEGVGDGSGVAHDMMWTPLLGCEDPSTARRRAQTLVSIGGLGEGSTNAEWGVSAASYVQALLYAAAVADRPVSDCYRWSLSPENAMEAADLIRRYTPERGMDLWAATLEALPKVDPRQKGSEWFGVKNAFSILSDPRVRARVDWRPRDPRLRTPRRMVEDGDTVFVLSRPKREGEASGNSGVFAALLLDSFQEACQGLAIDADGRGKIEPPARFVLDELSNIATWPGLRNAVTQGGGNGYQLVIVEQSRRAMAYDYGQETESVVWSNCAKVMLKGVDDPESLSWWVDAMGRHGLTRTERSWNPGQGPLGGLSERHETEDNATRRDLSQLPRGYALVQPIGMRPALVRTVHFMERGWWDPVLAGAGAAAGRS